MGQQNECHKQEQMEPKICDNATPLEWNKPKELISNVQP